MTTSNPDLSGRSQSCRESCFMGRESDDEEPCPPGHCSLVLNDLPKQVKGRSHSPLPAWSKHENAPRTVCPDCHFESSGGYPESHAPGCPRSCGDYPAPCNCDDPEVHGGH